MCVKFPCGDGKGQVNSLQKNSARPGFPGRAHAKGHILYFMEARLLRQFHPQGEHLEGLHMQRGIQRQGLPGGVLQHVAGLEGLDG